MNGDDSQREGANEPLRARYPRLSPADRAEAQAKLDRSRAGWIVLGSWILILGGTPAILLTARWWSDSILGLWGAILVNLFLAASGFAWALPRMEPGHQRRLETQYRDQSGPWSRQNNPDGE